MLNKPTDYAGYSIDLVISWQYCEDVENFNNDLHMQINHLRGLLARYKIDCSQVSASPLFTSTYDCATCNAVKAWRYSEKLERQNRRLEKELFKLNQLLYNYGMAHPEIMNDPGII